MSTGTAVKSWVPVVASTQVVLGSAGLVAFVASPVAAVVVGTAAALIALVCRALFRASGKLDLIMAEELDRQAPASPPRSRSGRARPGHAPSRPAPGRSHAT